MVRWLRWHFPPDIGFEIRALAVWGRARYLSVTEAPHNTDFHTWMGKKHFCSFQTAETGNRTPNSGVKGSGANHYPRAPARWHSWTPTQLSRGIDPMLFVCCADVEDGGPALEQHWANASCLLGCGHSWSANSSHWLNVSLIVAHHLQHCTGISPALAYQYIGLNKINVHPMLAYCWPIVYDHGSAVK